ncbi:hypothetical protein [Flaviflagellibacter deserti]|uniref:Glucose-methanol-choline oxidoreductase C-terminal domain-containing protein n=1 Tax=Flaviflagellibacter deserti TaxID=2267266 RepID=A0ABV9Z1H6_9HYPH
MSACHLGGEHGFNLVGRPNAMDDRKGGIDIRLIGCISPLRRDAAHIAENAIGEVERARSARVGKACHPSLGSGLTAQVWSDCPAFHLDRGWHVHQALGPSTLCRLFHIGDASGNLDPDRFVPELRLPGHASILNVFGSAALGRRAFEARSLIV